MAILELQDIDRPFFARGQRIRCSLSQFQGNIISKFLEEIHG